MKDISKLAGAVRHAMAEGHPAALATVVKLEGSGYRRPGARMAVLDDGTRIGFLSGGCLEADVAEHARQAIAAGEPRLISYDGRSAFDPVAEMGCNGSIRILVEPVNATVARSLDYVDSFERQRGGGAMATVFRVEGVAPVGVGARMTTRDCGRIGLEVDDLGVASTLAHALDCVTESGRAQVETIVGAGWELEALIEPLVSPISLILCGAGYDAVPLANLGRTLGWNVTVTDHREHLLTRERFPDADTLLPETDWFGMELDNRTAVVLMSHSYAWDQKMLRFMMETPVGYVGLLGPRKRVQQMRLDLLEEGIVLGGDFAERFHSPIGLDIGAETAEEIAVAVTAEIQGFFNGRSAGFLRERRGPIHEDEIPI